MSGQPFDVKHKSRTLYEGRDRAAARSYLKGMGYTDEDLAKPIIGIANTWTETMPCNLNLRRLAGYVKQGIRAAGGTPMEFNTIAISDGITMGTEGMKSSLVSREIIADSIELVGRGHMFDAVVALAACDKTMPGAAMGIIRLDVPSMVVYGGTILPGQFRGKDVTVVDIFEMIGAVAAGRATDADLNELEAVACPGAGACGGQYTANTMATVFEVMGLSPLGTASVPAVDPRKDKVGERVGHLDHGHAARGNPPQRHPHPRLVREWDRRRRRDRRLDERGPAPPGAGARGRGAAEHRRLRPRQQAHPADRRPQAEWALHRR
jgi:dihydroxy-acid dehydratase